MPDNFKIVLAENTFPDLSIERKILGSIGAVICADPINTEEELIAAAGDADGLMSIYFPITRKSILQMKKMKVMSVWGVGTNNIDITAASEMGIKIANVPDYCTHEVSTHAVALLLACSRQIVQYDRTIQKGEWAYTAIPLSRLAGKTVGIVGLGSIGRSVAKMLSGFTVNLLGYDFYVSKELMNTVQVKKVEFSELLSASDYITIHTPLTAETTKMFSEPQFKIMKKSAFLVNTSRGGVIDEKALVKALNDGWIAGAALDVLENEPPEPGNKLIGRSNVIITPHVAWYSDEADIEVRVRAAKAIKDVLTGGEAESVVNKHML